jgi:hypothetical protein
VRRGPWRVRQPSPASPGGSGAGASRATPGCSDLASGLGSQRGVCTVQRPDGQVLLPAPQRRRARAANAEHPGATARPRPSPPGRPGPRPAVRGRPSGRSGGTRCAPRSVAGTPAESRKCRGQRRRCPPSRATPACSDLASSGSSQRGVCTVRRPDGQVLLQASQRRRAGAANAVHPGARAAPPRDPRQAERAQWRNAVRPVVGGGSGRSNAAGPGDGGGSGSRSHSRVFRPRVVRNSQREVCTVQRPDGQVLLQAWQRRRTRAANAEHPGARAAPPRDPRQAQRARWRSAVPPAVRGGSARSNPAGRQRDSGAGASRATPACSDPASSWSPQRGVCTLRRPDGQALLQASGAAGLGPRMLYIQTPPPSCGRGRPASATRHRSKPGAGRARPTRGPGFSQARCSD